MHSVRGGHAAATARRAFGIALAAMLMWLSGVPARAHEIPADVRIQLFLKPDGDRLRLLVRAPVSAMADVEWPMTGLYLDLGSDRLDEAMRNAAIVWIKQRIDVLEEETTLDGTVIASRISLPSDPSFESYDQALAHIQSGPRLEPGLDLVKDQSLFDVMLEYPIRSERSRFSIAPHYRMLGLQTLTVLRFITPDGADRPFEFHDDPGLVRLDPRWFQAAWRFVESGFFHILEGVDHLLFLLCLIIPFRRVGALIPIVTAFTVAHSITLIAAAYDIAPDALWFPPLVETLIATSIVYMALENIVSPGLRRRWLITFVFGLIHGFGFSFLLRETLQFAGTHVLTSLLSFNIGVELGQVLVLVIAVPLLQLLFKYGMAERIGVIILSALVAHTGWHWMTERGSDLLMYQFQWPVFDATFFAGALRAVMLLVGAAGIAWLMSGLMERAERMSGARRLDPAEEDGRG